MIVDIELVTCRQYLDRTYPEELEGMTYKSTNEEEPMIFRNMMRGRTRRYIGRTFCEVAVVQQVLDQHARLEL